MNKQESMDILNECIDWLENASSEQVRMMQKVYGEEKNRFFFGGEVAGILLPSQVDTVQETIHFPNKKGKTLFGNNGAIQYCKDEFQEINITADEDFAA